MIKCHLQDHNQDDLENLKCTGNLLVFLLLLGSFLTELLEILTMQIQFCAWSDELINEPGDFR